MTTSREGMEEGEEILKKKKEIERPRLRIVCAF